MAKKIWEMMQEDIEKNKQASESLQREANEKFNNLISKKGEYDTSKHTTTIGNLKNAYKNSNSYKQLNNSLNRMYLNSENSIWNKIQNISMPKNIAIQRKNNAIMNNPNTTMWEKINNISEQNNKSANVIARTQLAKDLYKEKQKEAIKNTYEYNTNKEMNPYMSENDLIEKTKEQLEKQEKTFDKNFSNMSKEERNKEIYKMQRILNDKDGLFETEQSKDLKKKTINNLRTKSEIIEAEKEAEKINNILNKGNFLERATTATGELAGSMGKSAIDMTMSPIITAGSLAEGILPTNNFKGTRFDDIVDYKKMKDYGESVKTANIENDVLKAGKGVSSTIGGMIPSIIANITMPGSNIGMITQALGVGGEDYIENLNENKTNKLQSALSGTLKGLGSYATEKITGGNILGKGSLDDWATRTIANGTSKIENETLKKITQKIASKIYEVGGENFEELLENQIDHLVDTTVNNKGITFKEWLDEQSETAKQTTLTQLFLNLMGVGGDTYNEVQKYSQNAEIKQWINEAQKIIDKENLNIDNYKINNNNINEVRKTLNELPIENTTTNLQQNTIQNQTNLPTQQITQQEKKVAQNENIEQRNMLPIQNYIYEKSDNVKIDNLRQDASKYWDNSEKTKNYVNMLEKIIQDKDIDIRLDANLTDNQGRMANGSYSNGVITINPNSTRAGEFIAVHELTHAIGTDQMKNIVQKYRESNAEFDTAVKSLLQNYNTTELTEEAMSDVAGQLFGNQEFINNLAQTEPSLFRKIYNEIKYLWHQFTGYKNQEQFINDLQYKWEQAYRNNAKLNETTNYSVAGRKAIENIKNLQLRKEAYDSYKKAKEMARNKESNKKIFEETGWYKDKVTGKMKFNFSDKDMQIVNRNYKVGEEFELQDILIHKTLFEMYPQLRTYKVRIEDMNKNNINTNGKLNGRYNRFTNELTVDINRFKNIIDVEGTLIHEIQHAIQKIEKFAGGTSIKFGKERYKNNPGEIEARDTVARMIQEKYRRKDLSDIMPKSANVDTTILEKMKIGLYNYLSSINNEGEYNEASEIHQKENLSTDSKDNGLVLGGVIHENNKVIEESENNSGSFNLKEKQLEIIQKNNPMLDDYHTGIRTVEDIKTFDEVINDEESFVWGDFSQEDAKKALEKGTITVYSSKPIENGNFVSTSKNMARDYSGNSKIYSKEVPLKDVAWINGDEGQYANVNKKYSLPTKEWQRHLEENYKSKGTRTNLKDIKLLTQETSKGASINLPQKTSNIQSQEKIMSQNIIKNKKILNPTEISNLTLEDVDTTPTLPTKNYGRGNKQSSFFSNIVTDAKFLENDLRQEIGKDENIRYYKGISNQEILEKAYKSLNEEGKNATLNWFNKDSKDISAEDVAKGWILLKQYQDSGDYQSAVEVAKKMRDMGTKAGQAVQAYNILSRLTPEGMFYYAQSELNEAYNKMVQGKSQKWIEENQSKFDLTPEETQFIMDNMNEVAEMEDGYDKKVKIAEIQKIISDKIPSTMGQSIKSWMRISMLFNPKTQVRNIAGNAVILPVNISSDIISSGIDKAISKKTGVRTTGNVNLKNYGKGFGKGLYESYNDFRKGINTRNIEGNRFEVNEGKNFKDKGIGKALNRVDNVLSFALDAGDRGFYEATFTNSINNQLTLNNTAEVTQDMIDIATNEALQRTWQDNNKYTEAVLKIRKILNSVNVKGYGLGDVLIPFAKTPANLTKAIIDYSPVGLVKAMTLDARTFKNSLENGQFTPQMQHKFVQNLGKGMAGSFLYVLGYALAKAGIASGEADDDKDVKNFMKNSLGISSYSLKIGNKTFTYDWAQPVATPLAIMTNYVKYSKDNPDANILEKGIKSLNIGTEQLLQQSFMESLNTVLNGNGTTLENLSQAVLELPARAIPTFSKQIADMVDGTQRTSFEYDQPVKSAVNSVIAKIPVASKTLPVSRDTLGNEIKKYGGENNIWNVMFNPANVNKGELSKAGEEIYRLYQETGETTVFPITAPYYINSNGEKITMTSEERSNYQKVTGKYTEKAIEELLLNRAYKELSNDKKAELITDIISDSNAKAKHDILDVETEDAKKKRELIEKVSTKNYYDYRLKTKDIEGQNASLRKNEVLLNSNYSASAKEVLYVNTTGKEDKIYNILKDIDIDEYLDYKIKESKEEFSADKDSNGNSISGTSKKKYYNYINSNITDVGSRLIILGSKYKLSNSERHQLSDYINKISSNNEEAIQTFEYLSKNYVVKGGKVYYK